MVRPYVWFSARIKTPGIRLDLVGECRMVGIGVERSTMSSENSLSCAGFIKDSDSVRVLEVDVAGSMKDHDVYSRS